MRLPFSSMVILLLAAAPVAPLPAAAATLKVPKSAATLAMGSVDSGDFHLANILVNGQSVSQPVAPGSTVQISLDWSVPAPGCPNCILQGYIGFQGAAADCFANSFPNIRSGSFSGSLTAPDKAGTFLIMVNETADFQCDAVTSGGGGLSSIAAVVTTLKVK
jgi:hypothetical protein